MLSAFPLQKIGSPHSDCLPANGILGLRLYPCLPTDITIILNIFLVSLLQNTKRTTVVSQFPFSIRYNYFIYFICFSEFTQHCPHKTDIPYLVTSGIFHLPVYGSYRHIIYPLLLLFQAHYQMLQYA